MTHEYDDPIDARRLTQAVEHVVVRYRAIDEDIEFLAREVVAERFCSCVRQDGAHSVHDGIVTEIIRQVRVQIESERRDELDESSFESFPASDPPSWAGDRPHVIKE